MLQKNILDSDRIPINTHLKIVDMNIMEQDKSQLLKIQNNQISRNNTD